MCGMPRLLSVAVLAVLVGCGTQPIFKNADITVPDNRAMIQGTRLSAGYKYVFTFVESIDGKPASDYECSRQIESTSFWTGIKFGEWICADPEQPSPEGGNTSTEPADTSSLAETSALLVAVSPGPHDVVVIRDVSTLYPCGLGNCSSNPPGWAYRVELSITTTAGHMYMIHSESSGDGYAAWITDEASGAVVAGNAPQ